MYGILLTCKAPTFVVFYSSHIFILSLFIFFLKFFIGSFMGWVPLPPTPWFLLYFNSNLHIHLLRRYLSRKPLRGYDPFIFSTLIPIFLHYLIRLIYGDGSPFHPSPWFLLYFYFTLLLDHLRGLFSPYPSPPAPCRVRPSPP